ncbi:Spondin, partial [Dysosmobacter welbionis]
ASCFVTGLNSSILSFLVLDRKARDMPVPFPTLPAKYMPRSAGVQSFSQQLSGLSAEKTAAGASPRPLRHTSVHLLAAAEIHRAVLHGVQGVQTLAGAQRHTADSVVGNHCVDAGPGRHQLVKAGDQAAAARHDDAVGGDVRHQLRRRPFQYGVDGLHDPLHRLLKGIHHLRGADGDHLGQAGQQAAALHVHGLLLVLGEDTADLLLHLLSGALAHQQVVLAAHVLDHGLVQLVAGDLDGGALHHAGQGDDSDVRGAAADVHHHVTVGLGDVDASADGCGHRFFNEVDLPGAS